MKYGKEIWWCMNWQVMHRYNQYLMWKMYDYIFKDFTWHKDIFCPYDVVVYSSFMISVWKDEEDRNGGATLYDEEIVKGRKIP